MDTPPSAKAALWVDPPRARAAVGAIRAAGLELAAIGTDERGRTGELAEDHACAPLVDLRSALASIQADVLVIADPADYGSSGDHGDARAVADARARGLKVASLEPIPATSQDLFAAGWLRRQHGTAPIDGLRMLGLTRRSPAMVEAATALESFGPVTAVSVRREAVIGGPSLGALLFDAVDLAVGVLGEPELVTAAVRTAEPPRRRGPITLRLRDGEAHALLRMPDGRGVQVAAGDRAGRDASEIVLHGPGGSVRVDDGGFVWLGPDGSRVDDHRRPVEPKLGALSGWQRRVAASLRRLAASPEEGMCDWAAVLTACEAMLLSARTGTTESPSTMRRSMSAGSTLFE